MGYGPPGYRIGERISYRPSDVQRWMVEQGMCSSRRLSSAAAIRVDLVAMYSEWRAS
jgi:hypothetical protein